MLPKIQKARRMIDAANASVILEVDGGITVENIKTVSAAGDSQLMSKLALCRQLGARLGMVEKDLQGKGSHHLSVRLLILCARVHPALLTTDCLPLPLHAPFPALQSLRILP